MTLYEVAEEICRAADQHLPARRRSGRRPVYGGTQKFQRRPALARPTSCSTSTSTATTAPASAPATRPAGPASSPRADAPVRDACDAGDGARRRARRSRELARAQACRLGRQRRPTLRSACAVPHTRRSTRSTRASADGASAALGRPATLDDIPGRDLDDSPATGFDWVWFLSVWQTGPAGQRDLARRTRSWREEFQALLPDLREEDIAGSRLRDHRLPACTATSAATRRSRGCASGSRDARPAADARLRAQPHGARPPVGRGAPRVLRPRHARATWRAQPQNYTRVKRSGGDRAARLRPRSVLRRLARHAPAQLRATRRRRRR